MRHVKVSALIAMAFISFLSANATATAGCCGTWDGRGGEWVWRPVGWNWYGGLMWRAEGWGAPALLSPASDTDSRGMGLAYRTGVLTNMRLTKDFQRERLPIQ